MSLGYELESSHIVDYQLYSLPSVPFLLRGPRWPLEATTPQISFLGAAQTFGTFCKYPFPNLLGEMLSARVLNLATGGAGPDKYLDCLQLLSLVNASSLCVVQVMSGRSSVRNSYMESIAGGATVRITKGSLKDQVLSGMEVFKKLSHELSLKEFFLLVTETRENIVDQYKRLADLISVPKILLFVGPNNPLKDFDLDEPGWQASELIGIHPHLISQKTVERMATYFDCYVQVTESGGNESRLLNRYTGEYCSIKRSATYTITKHNAYISPHLHVLAAVELFKPVSTLLGKRS